MRAVAITEWGGPEVLRVMDLPDPEPGPGEVRIRVQFAGTNPIDTIFRSGALAAAGLPIEQQAPYVIGMDVAGIVDRVGPRAHTELSVGDRVIAVVNPYLHNGGTYADQVVVPAASVIQAPVGVDPPAAATVLMNALTVRLSLDALALRPGQTLAVTGAAGAVGGFAIEMAKSDGLIVIADAAPNDRDLVGGLGADVVVARGEDIAHNVRAVAPGGVDGLIDAAAQNHRVLRAIAQGGSLASLKGWTGPTERDIAIHNIWIYDKLRETGRLRNLRDLAERGALTLRVAHVLDAAQAPEAHQRLQSGGLRGRLLLDFTS